MSNKLQSLLQRYFTMQNCTIDHTDNRVSIQLTRKVDEQLFKRSFYWKYMDAIGKEGQTKNITYHFDNQLQDKERMHENHPFIHKIMNHFQHTNPFYHGFEIVNTRKKTLLHPYLFLNIKISYIGMHTSEEIISIGLNLINGKIFEQMMEQIQDKCFHPTISAYCYMISPIIYVESGIKRIEKFCDSYLEKQTYEWAISSYKKMKAEMDLTNKVIQEERVRKKQCENIQARFQPKIEFELIHAAMLHIRPNMLP